MKPIVSPLSVLILRSKPSPRRAKACVSKDGSLHGRRLWPSFVTHRLRDAPQDEDRGELPIRSELRKCSTRPLARQGFAARLGVARDDRRVLSEDDELQPSPQTGASHDRPDNQPIAPAHDRRHERFGSSRRRPDMRPWFRPRTESLGMLRT